MARPSYVHVVGAALIESGRCLVAQRGASMQEAGKWEFPGGKVEPGEKPEAALVRELEEELSIRATVGDWLARGFAEIAGETVVLDVYVTCAELSAVVLSDHQAVRWVRADEIDDLDWAAADVPALPALEARLRSDPDASRCAADPVFLGVDWSKSARKRSAYYAVPTSPWEIRRLSPPDGGLTLESIVATARELREEFQAPTIIAVDASLGVPTVTARGCAAPGFLAFLDAVNASGGLTDEAETPADWSARRPFFRVPPGGRAAFESAAGGRSALLRQIELLTKGNSTFILSGIPGTVGSGSRALWTELIALRARGETELDVWPFDGDLRDLTREPRIILAESYPRTAYALAVSESLPTSPLAVAKTKRSAREPILEKLAGAAWIRESRTAIPELEPARQSEDEFDALLLTAALVRLQLTGFPLSSEWVDRRSEGGILATGAIDFPPPAPPRQPSQRRPRRRSAGIATCPIPGCGKVFRNGRSGWGSHVASLRKHSAWHPDVWDPKARKDLFRLEFPDW